jgi:hypothetical protein
LKDRGFHGPASVIDGGIFAKVQGNKLLHVDWRIHTIGPERACLLCLGAVQRALIALDREGKLDDPSYIQGLDPALRAFIARQKVYPFSMSVAAHMVLQFVGLVTGQSRVGGIGPQHYAAYPGRMGVQEIALCQAGCDYAALLATAADMRGNCIHEHI